MRRHALQIPISTTSTKHYLPVDFGCRLVGFKCVTNVAEASGSITIGKAGAGHTIKTASLIGAVAGTPIVAVDTPSVTDAEKAQLFNKTTPLEITVIGGTAGYATLMICIDEEAIGSNLGV